MEIEPDIIKVEALQKREVHADRADLFVTIRGSSLVSGQSALNKAREVAQLAADLESVGIGQDAIQVQGVSAEVNTGFIGKTSSATYSLRVRVANLETLPDVIGVVTSQKNTRLGRIEWRYPDGDEMRNEMTRAAIEQAQKKARLIATAFTMRLLGVREYGESFHDPEERGVQTLDLMDGADMAVMRSRAVSSEELGLQISHSKQVSLSISVSYRVSEFASGATT